MIIYNEDLVRRMITKQFPQWSHLTIRPVAEMGNDNRTFHLGDTMSVRLPSQKCYAAQAQKEQYFLPKLQKHLTMKIPTIVGEGEACDEFPYAWSIYAWIDGETAKRENIVDKVQFAKDLAEFLLAFQSIDCSCGPVAGEHNFYRGGDLAVYNQETREVIACLEGYFDSEQLLSLWEESLQSKWDKPPVWVHGDLVATNMLVKDGKLHAIIDFGILGVGDPACDLSMYWTFFDKEEREVFKKTLALDEDTWIRARGWVLWKSLLLFREYLGNDERKEQEAKRIIMDILEDTVTF